MSLAPGTRLGNYEVSGLLGTGGMGEVYRAVDSRLRRSVALKILPPAVVATPETRQRFEREAQVLASLSHPNIAVLFGFEDHASAPVLVMELVEGPTLQERLRGGPIPLAEALNIARQICNALEAAHAAGVVHRDLKPGNIKITPEGRVKVLDFGLARVVAGDGQAASAVARADSPTLTMAAQGAIIGTAGYMSPEQARSLPVDKRADIWGFGAVLYEMLTGHRPFPADTVADAMAALLTADPDYTLLPPATPASVRRLLKRCLARDRKQRLHDIADARLELDAPPETEMVREVKARRSWLPWAVAGSIAAVAIAGLGWQWYAALPVVQPLPITSAILPPEGMRFLPRSIYLSPDGKRLLVRARGLKPEEPAQVLLRDLAVSHYRPLQLPSPAGNLLWSPDGRRVLFIASDELKALDIETGGVVLIRDLGGLLRGSQYRGSATNERGVILIGRNRGSLLQLGPEPAERKETSSPDEIAQSFPGFLPGGRWFYYTSVRTTGARLVLADLEGKEAPRALFEVGGGQILFAVDPADTNRGLFLYRVEDAISGRWFDLRSRAVDSEAVSVPLQASSALDGYLNLSVSLPARVLIQGVAPPTDMRRQLTMVDRKGKIVSELAPPGTAEFGHPHFSPDDKLLLGDRGGDLWVMDVARGVPSRVTFESGLEGPGVIAPDGRTVYYAGQQGSKTGIYRADLTGAGKPVLLVSGDFHHLDVSRDGKELAVENRAAEGRQIAMIRLDAPSKLRTLATPEKAEPAWPQYSPDGRWLMYISRESGAEQIYVQSHPSGKGKWQVSRDGGTLARWRGDGKEIVFKSTDRKLMRVEVRTRGDELEFGMPELLFDAGQFGMGGPTSYFTMTSDGQRFAFDRMLPRDQQSAMDQTADPVTILIDWMASLPRPGAAR